ncbi:MAG: M12 family metallo-peptidase [Psychroserpens sp.]|uniref:zinc-dependent metalloprotease n=1 Tax=Psychroserpens sp. TaxID=2020870 RepID=UPI0030018CEE
MKKNTLKRHVIVMICLSFCFSAFAQDNSLFWTLVEEDATYERSGIVPSKETFFELNFVGIKEALTNAPDRKTANGVSNVILQFPSTTGKLQAFKIFKASVLHQELQERFPELGSFIGQSIDNPSHIIRFSISPYGFKSVLLGSNKGTEYIEVVSNNDNVYSVHLRQDLPPEIDQFECGVTDEMSINEWTNSSSSAQRNASDGQLREFRLALACTEEYAAVHVNAAGLSGGTDAQKKAAVLAEMNDVMTRVNAVYENELSVTMVLVPTNENIIFLSSPFLNNSNYPLLIDQSQQFIDAFVGSLYDIGHMLSTGPGGLAQLFSPCTTNKARGVSGVSSGGGTQFEGILMHEMGHQYGSTHTWNGSEGSCSVSNITASSAYEPGSGSTILSYSGICGSQNVQGSRDLYFHQKSLQMMWDNITFGNSQCAAMTPSGNSAPTVEAGANYIIPIGTPYKLTGVSTDTDGTGAHTYCWEQYDLGPPGIPSTTTLQGPLVRSFLPDASPTRYIPRLEDVLANGGNSTQWEKLMLLARDINFRLTVRDNGVNGGQNAVDGMTVTTVQTGFFRVNSQNTGGISYDGGTTQTVNWTVAGTTGSGIDTAQVNILLSTDGGVNFDTVLLANTDNDGTADVTIPNGTSSTECRIIVEAVGNIFYNVNLAEFEIVSTLSVDDQDLNDNLIVYPNPNKGEFSIKYTNGFSAGLQIDIYDIRGRSIFSKKFDNTGDFNQTIKLPNATSGVYILSVKDGDQKGIRKLVIQ